MKKFYCVIGSPLGHSLSPLLHNEFFRRHGIDAEYFAFESVDAHAAAEKIRRENIAGASVTIPHKIAMMAEADEIDPLAKQIGAVNTLVNAGGRVKGYNTDAGGALDALLEKADVAGKKILIIGAGGVARAVAFGAVTAGAGVIIANRTEAKGKELAAELGGEFTAIDTALRADPQVIVNATSIGMWPNVDATPIEGASLGGRVVFDTVYNPLATRLLREAAERGCAIVSGLRMFVHQARRQFELWTGVSPDPDEMERFLLSSGKLK